MCEKCTTFVAAKLLHEDANEYHTRTFDYEQAKAGAPVSTTTGASIRVLTCDRRGASGANFPVLVEEDNGNLLIYGKDGNLPDDDLHKTMVSNPGALVMRPLGYCEGKPVFVGDTILVADGNPTEVPATWVGPFSACRWPVKYPRSRMSDREINEAAGTAGSWTERARSLADAVIARAIEDGDVFDPETTVARFQGIKMSPSEMRAFLSNGEPVTEKQAAEYERIINVGVKYAVGKGRLYFDKRRR